MSTYTRGYPGRNELEIIDADMTPRDVIEALKRLRFQDGCCAISIDKQIRDYLVTAVAALRQKKPHVRLF